jgi:hypothetical protein
MPLRSRDLVMSPARRPHFRLGPVRHKGVAALVLCAVLGIAASSARPSMDLAPSGLRWQRNPHDPRWVQGQIDLTTPAAAVWQRISEVRSWPSVFSDIASFAVKSESSDGAHWVIRFESRLVDHGRFDYLVTLDSAKLSGRVVLRAPGVRAGAYLNVAPIDDRRSRVSYAAFVERNGFLGWFLSDHLLRSWQERLVERDIHDLERAFRPSGGASATP